MDRNEGVASLAPHLVIAVAGLPPGCRLAVKAVKQSVAVALETDGGFSVLGKDLDGTGLLWGWPRCLSGILARETRALRDPLPGSYPVREGPYQKWSRDFTRRRTVLWMLDGQDPSCSRWPGPTVGWPARSTSTRAREPSPAQDP